MAKRGNKIPPKRAVLRCFRISKFTDVPSRSGFVLACGWESDDEVLSEVNY